MRKLLLLFAALLVAGCGEKLSPEGSDSPGASAEPSADAAKLSDDGLTLPLSDTDVERLLKEAVDFESLEDREGLSYKGGASDPYSGWEKGMYDSGRVGFLVRVKDGKWDGPNTRWHKNGQKWAEVTYKDGNPHGPSTEWHENGQKAVEWTWKDGVVDSPFTWWHENGQKEREGVFKGGKKEGLWTNWHKDGQKLSEETYKDGELVSAKYWNRKGEEVQTREEAFE